MKQGHLRKEVSLIFYLGETMTALQYLESLILGMEMGSEIGVQLSELNLLKVLMLQEQKK